MTILCSLFGTGVFVDGECVWNYVDSFDSSTAPSSSNSWWITVVIVIAGLLIMPILFKLIETKRVDDGEPTVQDVIVQGGRMVKARRAEKSYNDSERRIDSQVDEILRK